MANPTGSGELVTDLSVDSNLADYSYAQQEVMMVELSDDPIKQVVQDLEKHHATEKEAALDRQREEYERRLAELSKLISPAMPNHSSTMSASWMPPIVGTPGDVSVMWTSSIPSLSGTADSGVVTLMPNTGPNSAISNSGILSPLSNSATCHDLQNEQYTEWMQEREKLMKQSLARLREQVAKANALVREANFLSSELGKMTEYNVTLQIPSSHLSPNGKKGGVAIEPTILVKRVNKPNQLWSMDKFENKIIDMREFYEDKQESLQQEDSSQESAPNHIATSACGPSPQPPPPLTTITASSTNITSSKQVEMLAPGFLLICPEDREDPFFDIQEDHTLIGVANMYLRCVFYDAPFKYRVPIINQQGEITGKLVMELSRVQGELPDPQLLLNSHLQQSQMMHSVSSMNGSRLAASASFGSLRALNVSTVGISNGADHTAKLLENNDSLPCSRSESGYSIGSQQVTIRVRILLATQLPSKLANFVFCQYHFWGEKDMAVVPPPLQPDFQRRRGDYVTYRFNHEQEYTVTVTDDLLEHLAEDALSVELYGHYTPELVTSDIYLSPALSHKSAHASNSSRGLSRSNENGQNGGGSYTDETSGQDSANSREQSREIRRFTERWAELYRRLEFWVAIEELNDDGNYEKVEVNHSAGDVPCGGVYQLRHGQSRRVRVVIRPNKVHRGKGSLPLVCDSVREVYMGCIVARPRTLESGLDSYQDNDLNFLRDCWTDAVHKRQLHLQEQLQKIVDLPGKTAADSEREESLMNQWMRLTDERNAVILPEPGSGIPGAPASWNPPSCMERHCPLIFLNLNVDQVTGAGNNHVTVSAAPSMQNLSSISAANSMLSPSCAPSTPPAVGVAGLNCRLALEEETQRHQHFVNLDIVKRYETVLGAVASWDASRHNNLHLNRVTQNNERVYMVVKAVIRLSHPICVDLVLRKRIAVNIYKHSYSWTGSIKKQMNKLLAIDTPPVYWTGVTFQIVSSIPQASLELEERESLAQMAASQGERSVSAVDNESYIEKYLRTVSALDGCLQLDRSRQEIALKEILTGLRKLRQSQPAVGGLTSSTGMVIPAYFPQPMSRASHATADPNNTLMDNGSLYAACVSPASLLALDKAALTSLNSSNHPSKLTDPRMMMMDSTSGGAHTGGVLGGIRKYISVPNLQGLSHSLSNNNTTTPSSSIIAGVETQHHQSSSAYIQSLDHSYEEAPAHHRKRPEPPKALLMAAKNPLISPLATQNVSTNSMRGSFVATNPAQMGKGPRSVMDPLKEEIHQYSQPTAGDNAAMGLDTTQKIHKDLMENEKTEKRNSTIITPGGGGVVGLGAGNSTAGDVPLRKNPFHDDQEDGDGGYAYNNWMEELGSSCYNLSELAAVANANNTLHSSSYSMPSATSPPPTSSSSIAASSTWLQVGMAVRVDSSKLSENALKKGRVQFVGSTQFADGLWVGVELDTPDGKNNGSIRGVSYFHCPPNHGIFVRPEKLRPVN